MDHRAELAALEERPHVLLERRAMAPFCSAVRGRSVDPVNVRRFCISGREVHLGPRPAQKRNLDEPSFHRERLRGCGAT